jgi:hypothetical protein
VNLKGLHEIDRRTAAARKLIRWREDLIGAKGGPGAISPQIDALIDMAVRTRLYLESIDAWARVPAADH